MPNTSASPSRSNKSSQSKVVIFPRSSLTVDRERVTILHSTGSDKSAPCISELRPGGGLDFNSGHRVQNLMLGRRIHLANPTSRADTKAADASIRAVDDKSRPSRSTSRTLQPDLVCCTGQRPSDTFPRVSLIDTRPLFLLYLPALLPSPHDHSSLFLRSHSVTLLRLNLPPSLLPLCNGSRTAYRFVRAYAWETTRTTCSLHVAENRQPRQAHHGTAGL